MIAESPDDRDRLLQLLADQALHGLDDEHERELDELRSRWPREQLDSLEQAAAEVMLAAVAPAVAAPASLTEKLLQDARRFQLHRDEGLAAAHAPGAASQRRAPAWPVVRERIAWLVAAAALLLAASRLAYSPSATAPAEPSDALALFLASATDAVAAPWKSPDGNADGGRVIWSESRQAGYMVFQNLPPNDRQVEQYQLWIFDRRQDPRHPIDGGVFNVAAREEGETIVPIDAKLAVQGAYQFAITVERPGGVVVSSRERLPLLAQLQP